MSEYLIDDRELNKTIYSPTCALCVHLSDKGKDQKCEAFPDGIPAAIWEGRNDHKKPYPGDNGIRFEAKE